MKQFKTLLIGVLISLGCTYSQEHKTKPREKSTAVVLRKEAPDKVVEQVTIDLNNDGKTDTIVLSNPPDGDPGLYAIIRVKLAGKQQQSFKAKDVWDKVDNTFLDKNKNEVESKNLFVYKQPRNTIILLFGYVYGSGRDEFSVIQIKNNNAKMVFDGEMQYAIQFSDFNNDGKTELLCRKTFTEVAGRVDSLDADICTYDPFTVYDIQSGFKLNKGLSKKYNEENYVWAGLESSEKIRVLCPHDGKAKILR